MSVRFIQIYVRICAVKFPPRMINTLFDCIRDKKKIRLRNTIKGEIDVVRSQFLLVCITYKLMQHTALCAVKRHKQIIKFFCGSIKNPCILLLLLLFILTLGWLMQFLYLFKAKQKKIKAILIRINKSVQIEKRIKGGRRRWRQQQQKWRKKNINNKQIKNEKKKMPYVFIEKNWWSGNKHVFRILCIQNAFVIIFCCIATMHDNNDNS